jgi:hypothetical protein
LLEERTISRGVDGVNEDKAELVEKYKDVWIASDKGNFVADGQMFSSLDKAKEYIDSSPSSSKLKTYHVDGKSEGERMANKAMMYIFGGLLVVLLLLITLIYWPAPPITKSEMTIDYYIRNCFKDDYNSPYYCKKKAIIWSGKFIEIIRDEREILVGLVDKACSRTQRKERCKITLELGRNDFDKLKYDDIGNMIEFSGIIYDDGFMGHDMRVEDAHIIENRAISSSENSISRNLEEEESDPTFAYPKRYEGGGFHTGITTALMKNGIRGCGEYSFRHVGSQEFHVACWSNSGRPTYYIVWPRINEVMGPAYN